MSWANVTIKKSERGSKTTRPAVNPCGVCGEECQKAGLFCNACKDQLATEMSLVVENHSRREQ